MRANPLLASDDPDVVRRLIRENPWATLVSHTPSIRSGSDGPGAGGLIASHYPVLLDEDSPELAVVTHLGRPDDRLHGLGSHEVLLIVQGVHGYVSPSWYAPGASRAPTWNFAVAHCHGVPEILSEEANLAVLTRLTEHFERHVESPMLLDPEWGTPVARGAVSVRIPITRFECKVKMSQDKDDETRSRVVRALRQPGAYRNPALADEMVRAGAHELS